MKKSIKQADKEDDTSLNNTRPHTAKKAGYKEEVYNAEEEASYNKSELSENDKKNTAGPKS